MKDTVIAHQNHKYEQLEKKMVKNDKSPRNVEQESLIINMQQELLDKNAELEEAYAMLDDAKQELPIIQKSLHE